MKKLYSIIIVIVLFLCIGCTKIYSKEDVLEHLESKYGESFTFVDYPGSNTHGILIETSCTRFPDDVITARVTEDGVYSDNYMGYYWKEQIEQLTEESLEKEFQQEDCCRVYLTISSANLQGDELDKTANQQAMKEYMIAGDSRMMASIFVDDSLNENQETSLNQVINGLKEAGLNVDGSIVFVKHDSMQSLTRENGDYIDSKSDMYTNTCLYMIDLDWNLTYEKWE